MTEQIIDSTTKSVLALSTSGEGGFVVFAIVVVFFMFILEGLLLYHFVKSSSKHYENHQNNNKLILDLTYKIEKLKRHLDICEDSLEECKNRIKD